MEKVTKMYITFYFPGIVVSETSSSEIGHRQIDRITLPEKAYAFQLWDREDVIDGDKTYYGEASNMSPKYYPGGQLLTADDVRNLPDFTEQSHGTLVANMRINEYERVIRSCRGNFQPHEEGKTEVL